MVWAVKAENLKAVAEIFRCFNPKHQIVIAATDAHMAIENKPLEHAKKAAVAIDADLLPPPLSDQDKKHNNMSFGDLLKSGQIEAVKTALANAGINGEERKRKQGPPPQAPRQVSVRRTGVNRKTARCDNPKALIRYMF